MMRMNRWKVFLTGGDGIGWAVDEDLRLTAKALAPLADLVDLPVSHVVHAMWWEGLMMLPPEDLAGKRIICHIPGEPFRYFSMPRHREALSMVGRWVTRTRQAQLQMKGLGFDTALVPYAIDEAVFRPLSLEDKDLQDLRARWNIPKDAYLIGTFQRDTEGSDLRSPKRVKGPDVLLETIRILSGRGVPVHVVLAGPRRHWLLREVGQLGVPHTYVGQCVESDDLHVNALPRPTLNVLYNLIDLYAVTSRSEGGPHAILEAGASRCKVISTPVGMAEEVLEPQSIFRHPAEAARIIERDIGEDVLARTVDPQYERVMGNHRPESIRPFLAELYDGAESIPVFAGILPPAKQPRTVGQAKPSKETSKPVTPLSRQLTVGLWHTFFKPPYGGGNQFMMALRKALSRRDVDVRENELREGIDAYVLNSIHFDVDRFMDFRATHRVNVVHRIDGPIHLIRGYDREKDELCFDLNSRFASATVLQSAWTYQRIVDMGYRPVKPVIIHNAVDGDIFRSTGRIEFDPDRKIRLISSSWSNNPRKGGPVYRWIEEHLDWDRFEYTFVGNASESFSRIRHVPPVSSEELADLLRHHDIYITASQNDPCSNAVIEALACGLPVLYLNDGGHPELVAQGGLPFSDTSEIFPQLEQLVENYHAFQRLIVASRLEDVAEKYLAVIREAVL
jgi:glycosyltransferase involved in cell wall biosynthesis